MPFIPASWSRSMGRQTSVSCSKGLKATAVEFGLQWSLRGPLQSSHGRISCVKQKGESCLPYSIRGTKSHCKIPHEERRNMFVFPQTVWKALEPTAWTAFAAALWGLSAAIMKGILGRSGSQRLKHVSSAIFLSWGSWHFDWDAPRAQGPCLLEDTDIHSFGFRQYVFIKHLLGFNGCHRYFEEKRWIRHRSCPQV